MAKERTRKREKKFRKFRELLPKDDLDRAILYEALIRRLREEVIDEYPTHIKNFYPGNIAEKYTYNSGSRKKITSLLNERFKRMEGRYLQGPRTGLGFKERSGRKSGMWKLHPRIKNDLEDAFENWKSAYIQEIQSVGQIPNLPCYIYWVIREISNGKVSASKMTEKLNNLLKSAGVEVPRWEIKRVIEFCLRFSEHLEGLLRLGYERESEKFECRLNANLPFFASDAWRVKRKGDDVPFIVGWDEEKNPSPQVPSWPADVEGGYEAGEVFDSEAVEFQGKFAAIAEKLSVPNTLVQPPWVRFMYAEIEEVGQIIRGEGPQKGWQVFVNPLAACIKCDNIRKCVGEIDKLLGKYGCKGLAKNLKRDIVVLRHCPEGNFNAGISVEMFIPTSLS